MTKKCQMTNDEWNSGAWFATRHSSFVIRALTLAIRAYQLTLSPLQTFLFGPTGGCRFTPTCSQYAMDAIRAQGAMAGGWLAAKRICHCHPWGRCGHDPVPKAEVRSEKVEGGIILEHTH
jgi:putative membrane protein insertion efficiency factor